MPFFMYLMKRPIQFAIPNIVKHNPYTVYVF